MQWLHGRGAAIFVCLTLKKKKNCKMNYEEESWEPYDDNDDELDDIEDNFNLC